MSQQTPSPPPGAPPLHPTVIRTGRGLTVAGTRITLYAIMDYVKDGWPSHWIRDWLHLTDRQMQEVMAYIDTHREEVEAEYQFVLNRQQNINGIGKPTTESISGQRRHAAEAWPGEDSRQITSQEGAMETEAVAILVDHDVVGYAIWGTLAALG